MGGEYDLASLFIITETDTFEVYTRIECDFTWCAPTSFLASLGIRFRQQPTVFFLSTYSFFLPFQPIREIKVSYFHSGDAAFSIF